MTPTTEDLVKRLRVKYVTLGRTGPGAEREEAAARIEALELALKPFADMADAMDKFWADETGDQSPMLDETIIDPLLPTGDTFTIGTLGQFRAARNALKGTSE